MSRPSAMILDALQSIKTTDAEGRVLTVRPPNMLDQLRLFKALGPELARNELYAGMALVACAVIEIDGVPVPLPGNEYQIEALVGRLGNAGIKAATTVVDLATSDTEVREQAGNSAGTPI